MIERDVIQITDKDILNSIAYTLYKMTHNEVIEANSEEYKSFIKEFLEAVSGDNLTVYIYSICGFELARVSEVEMMCHKFNNWKASKYVTDTFLVQKCYEDYFKITYLNDLSRDEYRRVGKLTEMDKILEKLEFPYNWEYKKFFRLGCNFGKKD